MLLRSKDPPEIGVIAQDALEVGSHSGYYRDEKEGAKTHDRKVRNAVGNTTRPSVGHFNTYS
jgi:hypothetical protein